LKNELIGKLINIRGVITKRTIVSPQMKKVMLICNKCSDKYGPLIITDYNDKPDFGRCPVCNTRSFRIDSENTIYRN